MLIVYACYITTKKLISIIEFQINFKLANFSGRVLGRVSSGTIKTNYGTFKKSYNICRYICSYAKVCFQCLDSLEKKRNALFLGHIVHFSHR